MLKEINGVNHNVVFMDLGKNQVTVFNSESREFSTVLANDLFDYCVGMDEPTLFIGEASHFASARSPDPMKLSKSQYWYAEELLGFYKRLESAGHAIRMFPQKETEKIRRANGIDKTDEGDCLAMMMALQQRPHLFDSLQQTKKRFDCPVRAESNAMKSDMDSCKNFMREGNYVGEGDNISLFVKNNIERIASMLSEDARIAFGLVEGKARYVKRGAKEGQFASGKGSPRGSAITAIACTLIGLDGTPRLRPHTKELPGWRFAKHYLLRLHAFHEKGGVCRSDLMWHGFRHWAASEMDNKISPHKLKPLNEYSEVEAQEFRVHRSKWTSYCKELFMAIKKIINKE